MASFQPDYRSYITALDHEIDKLKKDWLGSIPFNFAPVCVMNNCSDYDITEQIRCMQYRDRDICIFMNSEGYNRLYFDINKYPILLDKKNNDPFKSPAFAKLRRDLTKAADRNASPILSNGGKKGVF